MIFSNNGEVMIRGKASELLADYGCIVSSLKKSLPAELGMPDAIQLIRHFTEISLLSDEERDELLRRREPPKDEVPNDSSDVWILPLLKRIVDLLEG